MSHNGTPEQPSLSEKIGVALRDEELRDSYMSVMPKCLHSNLELDFLDWGFLYGMAWGLTEGQENRTAVALEAAKVAFEGEWCGSGWEERIPEDRAERGPVNGEPGSKGHAEVMEMMVTMLAKKEI